MPEETTRVRGMMDDFDAILNVQALLSLEQQGEEIPANPAEAIALAERVREPIPEGAELRMKAPARVEASAALAMIHPEPEPDVQPELEVVPAREPELRVARAPLPYVASPVPVPVAPPEPAARLAQPGSGPDLPEDVDTDFFAAALPEFTTEFDDGEEWAAETGRTRA